MTRDVVPDVTPSSLLRADVVHAVNWRALLILPRELLAGKRVVCHVPHDVSVARRLPHFADVRRMAGLWIARSTRAKSQLDDLGLPSMLVPYAVEHGRFFRRPDRAERRRVFRAEHGIAPDAYCVGSFQRDTEADRKSPKLVKGPDVFAAIVERAAGRGARLHVVLAGPGRTWLRDRLRGSGVPVRWVGEGGDGQARALPHEAMNDLYNALDLYLVASRLEGGPQGVLEAAAAECKVLSTRVGHAEDVLDPACLYDDPGAAAELVARDAREGLLGATIATNHRLSMGHGAEALRPRWREAYRRLLDTPPVRASDLAALPSLASVGIRRAARLVARVTGR